MAYANLLDAACTDKEAAFQRIRDFICKRNGTYDYSVTGIGWTLHDAVYATDEDNCTINDYFVIYSAGESTKDDLYFKCTWVSGYFKIEGYQSWDSTAHTGSTNKYSAANNLTFAEAFADNIWVYGDLDGIILVPKLTSGNTYMCSFGKLDKGWDNQSGTITTCAGALSAGSDVSITVASAPANWAVGKEIYIRTTHNDTMATVKMEKITIKTLAGNVLTADLTNSYTADSALSDHIGYYAQGSNQAASTHYVLMGENGVANQSGAPVLLGLTTGSFDPGFYEDRFFLLPYFLQASSGLHGSIAIFRKVPSFTAGFAIGDVIEEDDGTEWRCFSAYSATIIAVKEV